MYQCLINKKNGRFVKLTRKGIEKSVVPVFIDFSINMGDLRKRYKRNPKMLRSLRNYTLGNFSIHPEEC